MYMYMYIYLNRLPSNRSILNLKIKKRKVFISFFFLLSLPKDIRVASDTHQGWCFQVSAVVWEAEEEAEGSADPEWEWASAAVGRE